MLNRAVRQARENAPQPSRAIGQELLHRGVDHGRAVAGAELAHGAYADLIRCELRAEVSASLVGQPGVVCQQVHHVLRQLALTNAADRRNPDAFLKDRSAVHRLATRRHAADVRVMPKISHEGL